MLQLRMQALPGPGGQMYRSTQHPPPLMPYRATRPASLSLCSPHIRE